MTESIFSPRAVPISTLVLRVAAVRLRGAAVALGILLSTATFAAAADTPAAQRIVSLVPAITEALFALGLGPRVVGVSTYCDFPDAAKTLPKVGTFTEPVAEVIVSLRPDLVLTSPSPGNETAVRAIERTGVTVAVVQSEGGLAEARSAMLEVARHAGAADAGTKLLAEIDSRLAILAARAVTLPRPRPRTAIVVGREPLVLAGPQSYLGELLTLAGGANVADSVGGRWPRVGIEFLVAAAPEVLVDLSVSMGASPTSPGSADSTAKVAAGWSELRSLPAVAMGRIVTDRASLMLRPGPRIADAAEALFDALHPDAQREASSHRRSNARQRIDSEQRNDSEQRIDSEQRNDSEHRGDSQQQNDPQQPSDSQQRSGSDD